MTATAALPGHDLRELPSYEGTSPKGEPLGGPLTQLILRRLLIIMSEDRSLSHDIASKELQKALDSYSRLERQLRVLEQRPEYDELGRVRPSDQALSATRSLLVTVASAGRQIPDYDDIDTDNDGAIRISWRNRGRFLELIVPFDRYDQPYLYWSEGAEYELAAQPDARIIEARFTWLAAIE